MYQRLSVAVVASVAVLLAGCAKGPVDTDPTVAPPSSSTGVSTSADPTLDPANSALEASLKQVAASLKIPGETGQPAVTSGAKARGPMIQLRDSVNVTPKSCRIAGQGVAALVTNDSPLVQAVYPGTKIAASVVAAKDEAAAKAFISERDGARAGCTKVTLASGPENSVQGTLSYPKLQAPDLVDGEALVAIFEGSSGITQVMGRKGKLIYLTAAQGTKPEDLTRLVQVAAGMQQSLPES